MLDGTSRRGVSLVVDGPDCVSPHLTGTEREYDAVRKEGGKQTFMYLEAFHGTAVAEDISSEASRGGPTARTMVPDTQDTCTFDPSHGRCRIWSAF